MPRQSNLRLTEQQEKELTDFLGQKRDSLEQSNLSRINTDEEAWARYNFEVNRRSAVSGMIWSLSNLPVPVFPMVVEHFVSRIEDSTTGEQPYWHFDAVNATGEKLRLTYNQFFNWKLDDQGGVHTALQEARLACFIQKASIQKAVYERKVVEWMDFDKKILHDATTGQPVEIAGHGPIIDGEDEFVDMPDPLSMLQRAGAAVGIQPQPTMRKHLKADPSFILDPQKHAFASTPNGLQRSEVVFSGARSEFVPSRRFLCEMDAPTVQHSSVVIEKMDKPLDWIRDNWLDRSWAQWVNYEARMRQGDTTEKVDTSKTNTSTTTNTPPKENRAYDRLNPVREVLECWVRRDVLGGGTRTPQEFVCWFDAETKVLICYEWLAKVCPDMKRPYTVTAITKTPDCWCGKSIWERGKDIFDAIDRLFNGEFYRTLQQANPPKGGDTTVAKEDPQEVVHDPTKFYQLHQGKSIDQLVQYAKVPDTNQRTQMVLEYLIYWVQLWLGVSNIAQGDYASAPDNNTKYGIQKVLQEASMLGRRFIRRVLDADEEHLTKLVQIIVATTKENSKEVFQFFESDQRKISEVLGAQVRTLNVYVKVVESQHNEEQDIERCNSALGVQSQFFGQLNPEVRQAMKPLLEEILTMLGFKDTAALLPDFSAMPMTEASMGGNPAQAGIGGAPAGEPQQPEQSPVRGSIGIQVKWDQLTPDERQQLMHLLHVIEPKPPVKVSPSPNPADKSVAKPEKK